VTCRYEAGPRTHREELFSHEAPRLSEKNRNFDKNMVMKPGIPKKETEIWHTLLPLVFQANPVLYQKQQHTPIARTTKNASSNQFFQTLENSKCCAASFLERRARRGPSSAPISPKWAPRQSVNAHLERLTLIYSFQIITQDRFIPMGSESV
jgi:hypothetical protein